MYLGIDFSGGAAPWKARCSKPTVWIAAIKATAALRLVDLRPVHDLPGAGEPFSRLTDLLRVGDYAAAGIDAPFAIPAKHLPPGGHAALLARFGGTPPAPDRPFPAGAALVELASMVAPLEQPKPHRETERTWAARGINTRSTLWNGPRGGAPFAAACLTLLARVKRPIWPWDCGRGMLAEAFPAAQLHAWALPHRGYGKPEQRAVREQILLGLAAHLEFDAGQREIMLGSPDALDAVIAAFAAIAAERSGPLASFPADGLIAVLDGYIPQSVISAPLPPKNFLDTELVREDEIFQEILRRPGVRIERITSRGHTTAPDQPFVQDWDEWVLVLVGSARLTLTGFGERSLSAGQHLLIPAGVPHWVTHTDDPTIWLAVHIGGPS